MRKKTGCCLLEIFAVLFVLWFCIFTPGYWKPSYKAREAEVKAYVHQISVALERYYVDHGEYPKMIWGGDKRGWSSEKGVGCRVMWENEPFDGTNEATARPPLDPLIEYGYLDSYPDNPFLNKREGLKTIIRWTGPPNARLGDGDPRFGYDGQKMGNIIEDPRYLWKKEGELSRVANSLPKNQLNSMVSKVIPFSPFYSYGGLPELTPTEEKVESDPDEYPHTMRAYWPGEFFYRSFGTKIIPLKSLKEDSIYTIWDFKYSKIDCLFMGGFGSLRTEGMDILRLTGQDGRSLDNDNGTVDEFYVINKDCLEKPNFMVRFSPPEILGGGNRGVMPFFPYKQEGCSDNCYGAPDGYKDGLIFLVTESKEW